MDTITNSPNAPPQPRRWRRIVIAGVLSLVVPGAGQLFNRQPRRGILFALASFLLAVSLVYTRALLSFFTMISMLGVALLWKVIVVADAALSASRSREESPVPFPTATYTVFAMIMVAAAMFPSPEMLRTHAGFAAFKIPSESMCPTLCLGDRVVVDIHAYRSHPPERGDLVMFKHSTSDALFVKRVIAVAGDKVSPGADNSVLVNGTRIRLQTTCAPPIWDKPALGEHSTFEPVTIERGQFFVIGDNLDNSYDSRFPEFGPVTRDMLRGRPLFLYWSTAKARIGCNLR